MKLGFFQATTAALLLASAVACGSGDADPSVDIAHASRHVAWVGEAEGGVHVVLEAIAPPQDSANARFSEESMLRNRLPLEEDVALMRLHLLGPGAALQADGEVLVGGNKLSHFGQAPTELDVSQRLLWNSVLRGRPAPATEGDALLHRSLVLKTDPQTLNEPAAEATWSHQQQNVLLELRTWTDMDRGRYFDQALTPPKKENG